MATTPTVEVIDLHHSYGSKQIYAKLDLTIEPGTVFGLLGKNGVGKSTLINILMGYLQPTRGQCMVFGEPSHQLSAPTRQRIALLYEGFTSYDYMTIEQIERFFSPFYPRWEKRLFYELIALMDVQQQQKLNTLSFGQKSQVILGLLFAQDADLLILDDYSMGLDAGYRYLLVDYLKNYIQGTQKTVLITSHIMSDLEKLVKEIAIVDRSTDVYRDSMSNFCQQFRCYEVDGEQAKIEGIHRREKRGEITRLYSFLDQQAIETKINKKTTPVEVSFEERFLGFVGKY
ncbi:ABC-2 type transport system ATP-binding protein [Desulfuromusa kysingii]|uniref:ABC-2 type transport system ATP-binding protein n=1 Tax=Desulfuromusa kysingii TaxID=37625 RepID=A0A1H3VVM8_9BACT|nr:ABC transporter ATP-binding protein [Desulfuromusa kysingii]SDZ78152.1 ABC-2 type transport system ATP-binding protein [Desulfuromusa kysingii]